MERLKEMEIEGDVQILGLEDGSTNKPDQDLIEVVKPLTAPFSQSVVRLYSQGEPVAMGVVVDQDGLVVSKASELAGSFTVEIGNTQYDADVIATDEPNDLALIRIAAKNLTPIQWDETATPSVGSFVVTPGASQVLGFGTLSHQAIPQRLSPYFSILNMLGLKVERTKSVTQIKEVDEQGPAHQAGVEPGEIIIAVNGSPISNGASFAMSLRNSTQGSVVTLSRLRPNGEIIHSKIRMSDDHLESSDAGQRTREILRVVSEMASPVSDRSRDFPLVFLHDTPINASDCGGPLIDLDGRAIGLNIARMDRANTAAIPARFVAKMIEDLIAQSR